VADRELLGDQASGGETEDVRLVGASRIEERSGSVDRERGGHVGGRIGSERGA
jgi:hypothetical protein